MQQTHARALRRDYTGLVSRRLSAITLVVVAHVGTACHDAATGVMAPTAPMLAVSNDGTWLVNSLADPGGDGVCTNSECTLREAILAAQNGDHVTFKSNLSGRIALTAGRLVVDKNLTIEARAPSQIVVDGQGVSNVFAIVGGNGVLVNLSGLTISGGSGPDGGGIKVFPGSTLNLIGSVVTGNTASIGGGISADEATVRVIGSTIAGNTSAGQGGGLFVNGVLTVARSTISGNSAADAGGGIYVPCFFGLCDNAVSIRSSTITQNDASTGGGILSAAFGLNMSNTIVAGNRVSGSLLDPEADCVIGAIGPVSLGYNLTSAGTGCDLDLTSPTDVILQSTSQVFTSVIQPVLAENGSSRPTHALIERGYAVDAGYCPGEAGDQRGFPRPYDDPRMPNALDGCDIGAFEWQPADTKIKGPKP